MNELVNIHNDLIDLPLRKLTATEIDILNTLCYECQEKQTNQIILDLNDIKKLSDIKSKDDKQFIEQVESMNKKLLALNFTIKSTYKTIQFVLFPTFITDTQNNTLTVQVHEIFAYLLNNLHNHYTSLELKESANLRSAYTKAIYRKLREFRNSNHPFWKVPIKDFREYLDIPNSYKTGDIDIRIIKPSLIELSPLFKNLKIEKYTDNTVKRKGRKSIAGFIFKFDNENKDSENKKSHSRQLTQEQIAEMTNSGWMSIPRICPKCHSKIYEKWLSNEFGDYAVYGHPDFKTGVCNFNTYNYADLMQEIKSVNRKLDETIERRNDDTDKKPLENKELIKEKSVPMPDYMKDLIEDWQRKADINNAK